MADLDQIIEALASQTERKAIHWVPTVELNSFTTSVGAISIVVRDLSGASFALTPASEIQLEVRNQWGEPEEVVSSTRGLAWEIDPFPTEQRATALRNLYTLARRSARGGQDTLDQLARNLGLT